MSFWMTVCKNPKLAGHAICGPLTSSAKKTLEMLGDELEELESNLAYLEYVPDFRDYANKIEDLRGVIGTVREAIAKPLAYVSTYEDGKALVSAIRTIRSLDPDTRPKDVAVAYGKAMKGLGKLVEKLGPPANAVGTLIAEMGEIFHKVVGDIDPATRPTNRREADRWKDSGVVIPGFE